MLAVRWSVKYLLAPIPRYPGKTVKKKEKIAIPKRYALKANTKSN